MSNNEYMSRYVNYRYLRLKIKAVEYKGGKCIKCGYNKYFNLVFHHRDPNTKDYDWYNLRKRSWNIICEELDKCDILCHNCHNEVHYDENDLNQMKLFFETRKRIQKPRYSNCLICREKFTVTRDRNKFCKVSCYKKWQKLGSKRIPDNIEDLLKEKPLSVIANDIGISRKNLTSKLVKLKLWPKSQMLHSSSGLG